MTELAVREQTTTAVALTSDIDSWAQIAGAVIKLANEIYDTPFVPDGLRGSAPAVAAAILAGRELGIGPMTALQQIHIIKGKPGLSALLMRSLIQGQGHDWQEVSVSDTEVTIKARRRGEAEWTTASFNAADARRAGIDLGKYPQDKLYARATSRLARRKFADVIAGMPYSAEELEDDPGDTPATETKPTGRVTRAEITGRSAAPQTASPATPAPRAPEPQQTPPAEQVAGEARSSGPAPSGQPAGNEPAAGPDESYGRVPLATGGQVGIIRAHFQRLGYSDDDRDARLRRTAQLARVDDLGTTKELDQDQARRVIDTLKSCKSIDDLDALLSDGEVPSDG